MACSVPERSGRTGESDDPAFRRPNSRPFRRLVPEELPGRPTAPGPGGRHRCAARPPRRPVGAAARPGGRPGRPAGAVPEQVGGIPRRRRGRSRPPERGTPEIRGNAGAPDGGASVMIRPKLCSSGDDRPDRIPPPPVRGRLLVRDDVRSADHGAHHRRPGPEGPFPGPPRRRTAARIAPRSPGPAGPGPPFAIVRSGADRPRARREEIPGRRPFVHHRPARPARAPPGGILLRKSPKSQSRRGIMIANHREGFDFIALPIRAPIRGSPPSRLVLQNWSTPRVV